MESALVRYGITALLCMESDEVGMNSDALDKRKYFKDGALKCVLRPLFVYLSLHYADKPLDKACYIASAVY